MENMDYSLEGLHDFAVIISTKFGKGQGLLLENVHDRVYRMRIFEFSSERMVDQFHPCLFLIALQGGVKEHVKSRARSVTHYMGKKYGV
jgi:hypothetical protein